MEKYRIFAHKPTRILEGQVPPDETTWEYPLEELTIYHTISGNLANVKAGMTVLVGSFPGNDDYGSTFVRHDYDGVSGTIQIARAPQGNRAGELNLRPDAYVTVLDDYRIWAKVPKFVLSGEDVTVYKHTDIEYGTNVTAPPPILPPKKTRHRSWCVQRLAVKAATSSSVATWCCLICLLTRIYWNNVSAVWTVLASVTMYRFTYLTLPVRARSVCSSGTSKH